MSKQGYAEIEVASSDNVPSGYIRFSPGDAAFTKAVKKLARESKRPIYLQTRWKQYGSDRYSRVEAYYAPQDLVEQVRERQRAKEEAALRRADKSRQKALLQKRNNLADNYPLLDPDSIEQLLSVSLLDSLDDDTTRYCPWEWTRLGFQVREGAGPSAAAIEDEGETIYWLYDARTSLGGKYADWDARRLTEWYVAQYPSRIEALVEAVWVTNRLVKLDTSSKRNFYPLKDKFLLTEAKPYLVEGRIARVETRECWGCDGTGSRYGGDCWKCDGSGIYSSATLYEHRLRVADRDYSFHSYMRPTSLSEERGADLSTYGRRFTWREMDRVKMHLPDYIRLLQHLLS